MLQKMFAKEAVSGTTNAKQQARRRPRTIVYVTRLAAFAVTTTGILVWLLAPIMFVYTSLHPRRAAVTLNAQSLPFPAEDISFRAADGMTMYGWFSRVSATAPVIVLGHGYTANRAQMVDYAAFLRMAGYSVLLFDWRAHGSSEGNRTTFGRLEVGDVRAALDYLDARPDLSNPRYGALGVSYGAAILLLAASADTRISAVIADSTYIYSSFTNKFAQMRKEGIRFGDLTLPAAPYIEPVAEAFLGSSLAELDPLYHVAKISPRPLLLIHAAEDHFAYTPTAGARAVFAAAAEPKEMWISPLGDHSTIIRDNAVEYRQRVLAFFGANLR